MYPAIDPTDDSRPTAAWCQHLADAQATEAAGARLAPALGNAHDGGLVIWLEGELGAGKTTLTRGLLRALGHSGSVKSPTYTLLEPYVVSRISLYHFDFYRFSHPDEFLEAGLEEYFQGAGIRIVEWATKALPHVPKPDVLIRLSLDDEGRMLECNAKTDKGRQCLTRILATP